ncbi:MAG: hypothetical protein AAF268_05830 [Cyanobacteria bacterium P01_A01_bin.3]
MATRYRETIALSLASDCGWLLGIVTVALGVCCSSGPVRAQSSMGEPSSNPPARVNLPGRVNPDTEGADTGWLSQTPNTSDEAGLTTEDESSEDEERENDTNDAEAGDSQIVADSGLQQLLDALDAEPDLGPLPLEPAEEDARTVSPYRLFVDLEVRGTSNAGFLPFDRDRTSDAVFTPTLTFLALPSISDNAQLIASITAGSSIYASENDLAFGYFAGAIGVNWDFAPLWFTRLELQGQQLLAFDNDDYQSLALQYQLGRGHLFTDSSLYLRYFYQLRGSLTNDSDLDRIGNSLNASVQFPLNSRLQGRILYRLLLDSFVNDSRTDVNNRIRGEVRYAINDILSVRGFTTYTNNSSTDSDRDYDDLAIGVGFTANFPLGEGQ